MNIKVIRDHHLLTRYESSWSKLLESCEINTVFQTLPWQQSWWQTFGSEYQTLLLIAEEDGEVIGIAPLVQYHRKILGKKERVVTFVGAPTRSSDYNAFIYPIGQPQILKAFLEHLYQQKDWTIIDFTDLPTDSQQFSRICSFCKSRELPCTTRKLYDAPTRILGDQISDLKATRKKSLLRHFNYFTRTADLTLQKIEDSSTIKKLLPLFFAQQMEQRQLFGKPSLFCQPKQREFFHSLTENMTEKGWLDFSVLYFNGQALAFHFGFKYNDSLIWYQSSFDPAYAKHGPGQIILKLLLEDAIKKGLREFDFTIGAEEYKYRFANLVRSNSQVQVHNSRLSYLLHKVAKSNFPGRKLIKTIVQKLLKPEKIGLT